MHLQGYRLRPGVIIDPAGLAGMRPDPASLPACIEASARPNETQGEIIASLACTGDDGARVARQAGVTQRTLQRHFAGTGLPPPDYWRRLGRARRAANGLLAFPQLPLIELAADHGYADQAHMTREFVHWFGLSPARLRRLPQHRFSLSSAGLGNWPPD
ncbi:MAG: AraC family transcriptional regulator [Lautropia sp.]|nr:AraC family transcriptional regulator [Lautropia sp.]